MDYHFERLRNYPPDIRNVPLFAVWAAQDILKHLEEIEGEAMHAGQILQDPNEHNEAFVRLVAGLIQFHWEGNRP